MKVKKLLALFLVSLLLFASGVQAVGVDQAKPAVQYRAHIQNKGWQELVANGLMSGTTGKSYRLEGIEININGADDLGIRYKTHVQNRGWQDWVADGSRSGSVGESLRLEAIQIELTGAQKGNYDLYYRAHAQNFGDLDWAKNGQSSGTAGYGLRLEGIWIEILPKGSSPSEVVTQQPAFINKAKEDVSQYKVAFMSGNLLIETVEVAKGDRVAKPQDPVKEGYTFSGWYQDRDFNTIWDFNAGVEKDTVLYAKWVREIDYDVVFKDGRTVLANQVIIGGTKVIRPEDPTKDGFIFGGWYTDLSLATLWNFDDAVNSNMTLYAGWLKKPAADNQIIDLLAINPYTVAVTFKNEIKESDLKTEDFAIAGLEVNNVVIHKEDQKILLLITSYQEENKEYPLVYKGVDTGLTFLGMVPPPEYKAYISLSSTMIDSREISPGVVETFVGTSFYINKIFEEGQIITVLNKVNFEDDTPPTETSLIAGEDFLIGANLKEQTAYLVEGLNIALEGEHLTVSLGISENYFAIEQDPGYGSFGLITMTTDPAEFELVE